MAKIPFSKLDVKLNSKTCSLSYKTIKGEEVFYEVKYYLPVKEKLEMISNIINQSIDENNFYNPLRIQIFTVLEIVYAYTNLSFTAKQKEDPFKLYDLLVSNGIFKEIVNNICEDDWVEIQEAIITVIDNVYKQKNSALGILESVVNDYGELQLDASSIQSKLADPNTLGLLKDIMAKLG